MVSGGAAGGTFAEEAAATAAVLHEGRFRLGVGSGEALNEHIHGDPWLEERYW